MPNKRMLGIEWFALLTAICWGAGSFFGKRAMKIGHLTPLVGIVLRTFTALLLFLIFLSFFGRKINSPLFKQLKSAWKTSKMGLFQIIIFEGVLAGGIGMFLYYYAISNGDLSLVMPLAFLSPFWGTLLALIFRDEKITFQRTAGLLITLAGVFFISSRMFTLSELLQFRVEYFALLTGLCWGVGSYFGKKGMKKAEISPFVGITIRTFTSLIILVIAVFSLGPSLLDSHFFAELSWVLNNEWSQFILILLFEGIIAGFLGMLLYYFALRKGDITLVMPLAFTSPFWGTILALIWKTEVLTNERLMGLLLIIYGITFTTSINLRKPITQKLLSDNFYEQKKEIINN